MYENINKNISNNNGTDNLIISPEPVVNRIDFLHDDKELREEQFDSRITMWRVYFSRQSDCRFSDHL